MMKINYYYNGEVSTKEKFDVCTQEDNHSKKVFVLSTHGKAVGISLEELQREVPLVKFIETPAANINTCRFYDWTPIYTWCKLTQELDWIKRFINGLGSDQLLNSLKIAFQQWIAEPMEDVYSLVDAMWEKKSKSSLVGGI